MLVDVEVAKLSTVRSGPYRFNTLSVGFFDSGDDRPLLRLAATTFRPNIQNRTIYFSVLVCDSSSRPEFVDLSPLQ